MDSVEICGYPNRDVGGLILVALLKMLLTPSLSSQNEAVEIVINLSI